MKLLFSCAKRMDLPSTDIVCLVRNEALCYFTFLPLCHKNAPLCNIFYSTLISIECFQAYSTQIVLLRMRIFQPQFVDLVSAADSVAFSIRKEFAALHSQFCSICYSEINFNYQTQSFPILVHLFSLFPRTSCLISFIF